MAQERTFTLSTEAALTVSEVLRHHGLTSLAALFAEPREASAAEAVFASGVTTNDRGQTCMTLLCYMEHRCIATAEELMQPDFTLRDGFKMRALARRYDAECVRVSTPKSFADATGVTEVNAYPLWLLKKHFGC